MPRCWCEGSTFGPTKAVSSVADCPRKQVRTAIGGAAFVLMGVGEMQEASENRLWSKIVVVESCWIWTAAIDIYGYGMVRIAGKLTKAHRAFYELRVGRIPYGLVIDHLCHTPACVNPDHMEPVTHKENSLRGNGVGACCARQTHCIRGHEFTPENTYRNPEGHRRCRICGRAEISAAKRWRRTGGTAC